MAYQYEKEPVACVCGNELRIYGPICDNGKRQLLKIKQYQNYGQAKFAADEFDDGVKRGK